MGKKQKIERLEAAVANARTALAIPQAPELERAAEELRSAILDAFEHAHELDALRLHDQLKRMMNELELAALHRTLTACPCCGGNELLVSQRAIAFPFPDALPGPEVLLVACRACGDLRMRIKDPPRLAEVCSASSGWPYWQEIVLPAKDPEPYR
jgi:hypothetical protein